MDNTRHPQFLQHEYYSSKVVKNYMSVGPSYGVMEMLHNRERGEIIDNHHGTNYSCDDDYLKPSFCKRPKIDIKPIVECQFAQIEAQDHQLCPRSVVGDSMGTNNTSSQPLVHDDDNLKESSFPNGKPLRGILKVTNDYNKQYNGANGNPCLMLANTKLNMQNGNMTDYEMNNEEVLLYNRERSNRYSIFNEFLECKLAKGEPLSPHVEKMIGFFERLGELGSSISQELAIDIILRSLPDEYNFFITVFLKCDLETTIYQLHEMLQTAEKHLRERNHTYAFLAPKKEGIKKRAKKKGKGKGNVPTKDPDPKPKCGAKSEDVCHYCNEIGHWKRNCKKYLEYLKK